MAAIKRHWKLLLTCVGVLTGLCGFALIIVLSAPVAAGEDPPEPETLAPVTYSTISWLREQIGLSNEAIAAMGCSQATAEGVLTAVTEWYGTNKAALAEKRQAEATAKVKLRKAVRKMNVGPADATLMSSIPKLKSNLATAMSQRMELVELLVPIVEGGLSNDSQKATWKTLRKNRGATGYYRYLSNLTVQQIGQLRTARYRKGLALASAKTAEARAAVITTFQNSVATILSSAQCSELATIRQTIAGGMSGALAAEKKILPEL